MNQVRQQIRSMLEVEPRQAGFRATLRVDAGFMLLPDHFAANPILPGVCLIQAVLLAGAVCEGVADLRLRSLKRAKFLAPATVGDEVVIDAEVARDEGGCVRIQASLSIEGRRLAQLSLVACADAAEAGDAP